jgi:hypothetical protein
VPLSLRYATVFKRHMVRAIYAFLTLPLTFNMPAPRLNIRNGCPAKITALLFVHFLYRSINAQTFPNISKLYKFLVFVQRFRD